MELIETERNELEIGKEYYFDASLKTYGVFVKRTKRKIKFKRTGGSGYHVKRGTVDFSNDNNLDGFYLKL